MNIALLLLTFTMNTINVAGFAPWRLRSVIPRLDALGSNDDGGGVFFDDFGDFGSSNKNDSNGNDNLKSLKSRMSQVKSAEEAYDAKLARNWRRGNWGVRGFALDKFATTSDPVLVSAVVAPRSSALADTSLLQDRTIVVGRTDGSVFVVKLGDEYLTSFVSVPTLVVDEDDSNANNGDAAAGGGEMSVRVENEWMGTEELRNRMQFEQSQLSKGAEEEEQKQVFKDPFVIRHQFLASDQGEAIKKMIFDDTIDGVDCHGVICTAAGTSGEIKIWSLPHSSDVGSGQTVQIALLSGVHRDAIVCLETMVLPSSDDGYDKKALLSVSRDGTFALWDLSNNIGELISAFQCANVSSDCAITCADVSNPTALIDDFSDDGSKNDNDVIALGTSTGNVIGYMVEELLSLKTVEGDGSDILKQPSPNLLFRAHGGDTGKGEAVTAIKCGGGGTIASSARLRGRENAEGSRSDASSFILLTGGEDGMVKQWEILSQKSSKRMEHWPRMATQRMKRRAHIFTPGHDGPVSSIAQQSVYDSSKFISCGKDGSVSVWSASSGEELTRMDGFTSSVSSLACLGRDLLVTDGMEEYVCVNDFAIDEDAADDGYDLDW